tara:strand:+ start:101 stop:523 length:423 start_codon:yes stop_codon:yes gene_type:complete
MSQPPSPPGPSPSDPGVPETLKGDGTARDISGNDLPVRHGSPFAASPPDPAADINAQAVATRGRDFDPEWGVLRAANWASAWVAICGLACLQYFPEGGVIVAALGCGLATLGLFSSRAMFAAVLLALHAWLFFACYQRLF